APAGVLDRHRLARAGRAQGHRRLGPVPALPGLRHRGGNGRVRPRLRRGHRLGRGQAAPVRPGRARDRAAARTLPRPRLPAGRHRGHLARRRAPPARALRHAIAGAAARRGRLARPVEAAHRRVRDRRRRACRAPGAAGVQAVPRGRRALLFQARAGRPRAAAEPRGRRAARCRPGDRGVASRHLGARAGAGRTGRGRGRVGGPGRAGGAGRRRCRARGEGGLVNPLVELNLTLILFLPWFAILAVLYWLFPRQPRGPARVLYDLATLALSVGAFLWSVYWAIGNADGGYGRLWPQILATAVGYGVFLAVLAIAFGLRFVLF